MKPTQVQWRILVRLLPLLALVFAGLGFWLSLSLERSLVEANREVARRTSRAVVGVVESAMLARHGADSWPDVRRRIEMDEATGIEILGRGGNVVFSAPASAVFDQDLVLSTPLENGPDCVSCHRGDGDRIGTVRVRQSTVSARRHVRSTRILVAAAAAIALLVSFFTIRILLTRHVGRPLRRLVDGARSIGEGRLDGRIGLDDGSELTILSDALDASTERLAALFAQLERQRDDFETLYRFTDQLSRTVLPADRRKRAVELANRFLGAECVLVRAERWVDTRSGTGTVTMRSQGEIEDHAFAFGPDGTTGIPSLLGSVVERWLAGEFDEKEAVEADWVVAYPLERGGRRVGMLLLPAGREEPDGASAKTEPDIMRALCRHIGIALEFSDLQRELVGSERLAAIGETVAGLAHCLKNTLNGLRAGQYVVDRGISQENPVKIERGWRVAKSGIRQVERLMHDMLYYVKEREPRREPVSLAEVVGEVVELMRETAAEKGVALEAHVAEEPGRIGLDRTAIYRAVLNLVTNAIDACIESEDAGRLVVVETRYLEDEATISVADDGVGMTREVQAQLFQRFFSTKAGRGTGLGLPVVKKIAEEHGGRLTFASGSGEGTTFRIHLPLTTD